MTCFVAYITATYMVEAISVANAVKETEESGALIKKDQAENAFYIKEKIEIGVLAERLSSDKKIKNLILLILGIYMYGAIILKYVGGADSFEAAVNHTFWEEDSGFRTWLGFDPYYLGIAIFGFFSMYFSFGNIENAKTLQVITTILRFVVTFMMCGGSIYYIDQAGTHIPPVFDWKTQIKFLAQVFGNTTFVFIYHHSISGIIAPIRPQSSIHSMFMWSNIVGSVCLGTEGLLAWFAFGSL